MKLEYFLLLLFLGGMIICTLAVFFSNKEQKKTTKEAVDKARMDWAKAFDAADALHLRQANTYLMVIDAKDELIAEKDKRIEQLENDIALKDFIMKCAKVDGSFNEKKLKEMFEHIEVCHIPFTENAAEER